MSLDKLNHLKIDDFINEIMQIQDKYPNYGLYQFKSLVSANQYCQLYEIFLNYIAQDSKVLDWGCGNGHFSYFLLKACYQASGFSFNDFKFREYLNQLDYEFEIGHIDEPKKIPFSNNTFDAVVSVGVLEHVRETGGNEIDSLKEIYRILKPGGYFICYHFPNKLSWIELISSLIPDKHHHEYRYNRKMIYSLCQQTGLEIVEVKRYGFLPRNIWCNLPKEIKNNHLICNIWNISDEILKYPFSLLSQNYLFIARKQQSCIS